jgi:hypothetical protein
MAIDASKEEIKTAGKKPAGKKARNRVKVAAKAPWTFPKNTLEQALLIPKAIEEQNAGNPMASDVLCKAVGFRQPDWRFLELLKSANQYGLVSGSGAAATVRLEQLGQDVVAPSSPQQRPAALLKAFRNVEEFKKVEDFYKGKRLPEDEFFENNLVREFGIPRERVPTFIEVFTKNLSFLRAFKAADGQEPAEEAKPLGNGASMPSKSLMAEDAAKGRTFLDTCFVMMPFVGDWFDRYYKELFVPAIKEAGMEALRADELFSTGTVIEQIWEQIGKAKILLADLTGKNANVFYELGLAHAAHKPVVFTSGNLEDVPFDLRHLRVIIYDVQDPFWGEKLKTNLTAYLKNAKNDPTKSIPQPFRHQVEEEEK